MNEHGYCPNCGINFDGELILDTFMEKYNGDKEKALESASYYAGTRWGKRIAIYDLEYDRTVAWKCPDCDHEWPIGNK